MEYTVVNNPNYQPQQEHYTPDGQQYVPDGQPQGNNQGGFQPPQQNGGQYPPQHSQQGGGQYPQQGGGQYPQQSNYQPNTGQQGGYQNTGGQQAQYSQQNNQGNYQNGGGQQKQPVQKRATQSGQPVQGSNLVILEGYMNGMNFKQLASGTSRLGFKMVIEVPVFQGGQQQFNQQTGQPLTRDVSYLCQAWGSVADQLSQWPEGTAVKVTGSLNRWSMLDQNTGQQVWYTDVKVSRFDIL